MPKPEEKTFWQKGPTDDRVTLMDFETVSRVACGRLGNLTWQRWVKRVKEVLRERSDAATSGDCFSWFATDTLLRTLFKVVPGPASPSPIMGAGRRRTNASPAHD